MNAREREAAPGALSERLRCDNRRLDGAVGEVGRRLREGPLASARDALNRCTAAWERQVRLEEEVLYPLFELRLGTAGAGTAAMRDEHREILRAFASLEAALSAGRRSAALEELEALRAMVGLHLSREDRVVYPALDAMLSDGERARLLARVETPCPPLPAADSPMPE